MESDQDLDKSRLIKSQEAKELRLKRKQARESNPYYQAQKDRQKALRQEVYRQQKEKAKLKKKAAKEAERQEKALARKCRDKELFEQLNNAVAVTEPMRASQDPQNQMNTKGGQEDSQPVKKRLFLVPKLL